MGYDLLEARAIPGMAQSRRESGSALTAPRLRSKCAPQQTLPIRGITAQLCVSAGGYFNSTPLYRAPTIVVMKPQETPSLEPKVPLHLGIALVITHMDEHLDERLSLNELATKAGLSVWRFSTLFRQHAGVSTRRYICRLRVQKVQSLLAGGESLASAALATGFYDQSHLCRHFKNACGMTPSQYISHQHRANAAADRSRELEAA